MNTQPDELEAVRSVVAATKLFKPEDQMRILRFAAEILDVKLIARPATEAVSSAQPAVPPKSPASAAVDLRSFIQAKNPHSDVQFSAAVAYYFRFEAPPDSRKEYITASDLEKATRHANWRRFQNPKVPLNNARQQGYLDTGPEKATFTINSVGENLIAMILPDGNGGNGQVHAAPSRPKPKIKRSPDRGRASKRKA